MNRLPMLCLATAALLPACAHETAAPAAAATAHDVPVAPEPPSEPERASDEISTTPAEPPMPPPAAEPVFLPPSRPCEVIVTPSTTDDASACITLERVQPASEPLGICFQQAAMLVFEYDAQERIVFAAGDRYVHRAHGAATRTRAGQRTQLVFDEEFHVVREGRSRSTYDELGRLLRTDEGAHHLAYVYAADDTYTTEHDYPDTDEFCVADRVEVGRDARGNVAFDRYDNCQINEIPRTLRYTYEASGALVRVEIDLRSDGTTDGEVTLRYLCDD